MEIFPRMEGGSGYMNRVAPYSRGQVGGREPSKEILTNQGSVLSAKVTPRPCRAGMPASPQLLPCICCPGGVPKGKPSLGLFVFMPDGTSQPSYPEIAGVTHICCLD